ncbi:MAG: AMP-binding protein [Bacteroidaceae bacterium]|nr:AMP-binding protein [Bacteroidaceae bacterium]
MKSFIKTFEETVKCCWDNPAINDYNCSARTYGDLAREIAIMHLVWREAGLQPGDKISLNARSSADWATTFMAVVSGGYVSCQLFHGFTSSDAQKFTNHSESKILYTEQSLFTGMNFDEMPQVIAVIDMKSRELLASRGNFAEIYARRKSLFDSQYVGGFSADNVVYANLEMETLCCLNYTSGSTGIPKGVMLTVGNLSSNVDMIPGYLPYRKGEPYLSVLPFAHIFGMTFDMITTLAMGMHVTVLGRLPAPTILKDAIREISPRMLIMVPLVLSKFTDFAIGEFVHAKTGKTRLADYKSHPEYCQALRTIMMSYLGGKCEIIVTGGAAIPEHLEQLLALKLKLPLITGYGMTECAPLITLGTVGKYKLKSCGEVVKRVETHIESPDPQNAVGELWVKGANTFVGYYKNPQADSEVFTADGWFRTGDLGVIDKDNTLFLVGRCKSMLLASNGENVYPEEIEVKLNAMPYVAESIIVQRGEKFVAIIVPNAEQLAAEHVSSSTLTDIMNRNIEALNKSIPIHAQISSYELHDDSFAKTPKGSIKRFMYS